MINWKEIQEGKIVEVTEEEFDSFLNALPPKFFKREVGLMNGQMVIASFGFCEGMDRITAFWRGRDQDKGRYYAADTVLFSNGD